MSDGFVVVVCGGSGKTLFAADRLARRCNIMEFAPMFADVIIRRWQEQTGKVAVLAGSGAPYPQEAEHDAE